MAQNEKQKINLDEVEKFGFVNSLNEDVTARIPHPEDTIFDGSESASRSVSALNGVVGNPSQLTIKWDGFPALIFGRDPDGRLVVMDKYMFKRGMMMRSPQEWQQYDLQKNPNNMRPDLYKKLEVMWKGLDAVVKGEGYYWGDLLWAGSMNPISGKFIFKPNVVEYRAPINSYVGKLIPSSVGGIVVHQYFTDFGGTSVMWNGTGLDNTKGGVAIISPSMGIRFALKDPVQLSRGASSAIKQYGTMVDDLLTSLPASAKGSIKTYFNKLITGQTESSLQDWISDNINGDYSGLLIDDSGQESAAYTGLKAIWNAIYAFKLNLVQQLDPQVQGIEQYSDGKAGGEGYVFPANGGSFKLVNRGQFSKALFAKNAGQ